MIKLTRVERKILANQYAILEIIDPNNSGSYSECREILERGFEADYPDVLMSVYDGPDTMSVADCTYVDDVLQMYDMMQTAYKNGATENVDSQTVVFPGFDGNNETKFMSYARFMRAHDKWDFLDVRSADLNSHFPTSGRYEQMLERWRASKDKHQLTAADIVRIVG